jgi:hypothetical protein
MPVFDITNIVAGVNVTHYDPLARPNRFKNIMNLVEWLSDNVGEYYGVGEDHTVPERVDVASNSAGTSAIRIGSGWEIVRDWRGDPDGYVEVWWRLDITDEAKATLFALKWL